MQLWRERFTKPFPARATIEVSALPKGLTVEMDAIVEIPNYEAFNITQTFHKKKS